MPDRVLVIDKPTGPTSRQVVSRVARALGARKAGHAGTLDPLASGVLVVCLDRATLLTAYMGSGLKRYRTEALLGVSTDTFDVAGRVLRREDASGVTEDAIKSAVAGLTGAISQVPPAFSAVKLKGKPLYKYAREGLEVTGAPRDIEVSSIELVGLETSGDGPVASLEIWCGPGTYVRSIIADLGAKLGTGACVSALRRLASGRFDIAGAVGLDELEEEPETARKAWLTMEEATRGMPGVTVEADEATCVSIGKPLRGVEIEAGISEHAFRVLDPGGRLVAIYGPPRKDDEPDIVARAVRVLRPHGRGKSDATAEAD